MKRIAAILAFLFVGTLAHAQTATLSGVQVSPFGSVLQSGSEQFSATCVYTNGTTDGCAGQTITWSSSQPSLVTVNGSGLASYVTNCGSGVYPDTNSAWECWVHIVATVNGFSDYATIYVQYPGDTFQIMLTPGLPNNPTRTPTLVVGATATFGAGDGIDGSLTSEGNANPFPGCNWSSSDTAVGTIDRYGFFTAVTPGTATVTCGTAGNGSYTASPYQGAPATYAVTVVAGGTGTNTWYVRPDGGTPYTNAANTPAGQCNGLVNAPYPGTGVNQPCALGNFEYLYFDQVTGTQQWMISGGDTVIVYPKTGGYDTAIINASANTPSNCQGDMEYCDVPAIPSGTASQPTRILGSNYASCTGSYGPNSAETTLLLGYGRELIRTDISQYIDVECFEMADNSATNGFENGIVQSSFTSYATFKNIFIHNASQAGVFGASGLGVVDDHVHIRAARMTGYNMDDAPYGISNISVAGGLTMTNSNIEFTGCKEIYGSTAEYPFAANECLDQNTAGQGDGLGTGAMTGSWYYDNDIFRYNFQDGLDNLHSGAQSETVINSQAYGNDGQQFKFGDVGKALFQNNLTIGNCNRIMEPFNGVTIAMSGVAPCRAGGGATVFEWAGIGSYTFQNNTFIGIGNPLLMYQCENTWTSCTGATTVLQNNLFAGYSDEASSYNSGSQAYALYAGSSGTPGNNGWVTRSNNDFYNVWNYTPQMAGDIAVDPLLTNEPPFLTGLTASTESLLDNYNYTPSANSPVLGAGVYLAGLTTDANGVTRPDPPAIGALEYAAGTTHPASQVTISATPNPVTVGQSVTLSASIASANSVIPTGTVIFSSNGTSLGSGVVNNSGTATLTVSLTTAGSDSLTAIYSGDASYAAGTSPALSLTVNSASAVATTTVLQASLNPIAAGQTTILTATVTAGSGGVPSGTVSFLNNGVLFGTATLNSAGTATLTTAPLTAGSYSMTATYAGNTSFSSSKSAALVETVHSTPAVATTTLLQVSSNPITAGQTATLTATVVAGSGGVPSGSVSFLNDGALFGTATLNTAGTATLVIPSSLAAGSYSMTAKYAGNTSFNASNSAPLNETVNPAPAVATTTLLHASSNPITAGQTAVLTATVAAGSGGVPSGTVSFLNNGAIFGTATLNAAGIATLVTPSSLATGSYSITAKYAGNANFNASNSAPLNETVNPAPAVATTTLLQVSLNSITVGQTAVLTATVAAGSGGVPSGTVSFLNNGAIFGTATLNAAGIATLVTPSSLATGSYSITAKYAGNANFNASTSVPLNEVVNPAPAAGTTTMLQASLDPITTGQTVTLTATVVAGAGGVPSGTVSFLNNGALLGTASLNSAGTATLTTPSLTTGSYSMTATFGGNTSFSASTSAPLNETVTAVGTAPGLDVTASTPTLTIENGSSTSDAEILTLTAVGGYSGTIQMTCANLPSRSSCSFQPPAVTVSAATGPVTVVMTVQNSGTTTATALGMQRRLMHGTTLAAIFWLPGLFAAALIGKKRKLLLQSRFLLLLLLLAGVSGALTGCGSTTAVAIPAAQTTTFQVMVTGTGNVAQTINLNVTTQ